MKRQQASPSRRPLRICATSIAAFLAGAIVSQSETYKVDLGDHLIVSSTVPDFVTKDGLGTLVLTGAQTYTGATTVNEGTLLISNIGNLGNTSSISINHNPSSGSLGVTGTTQGVSAGQLFLAGTYAPQTFDFGPLGGLRISGGGPGGNGVALNVIGNTTLSGGLATSSTSATRIASNFGVLTLPTLAISGGGTIAQTLTLLGNAHYSVGAVSGAGTLVKSGPGTLVFTGTNTNTGILQIDAGFVRVSAGADLGGTNTAANAVTLNGGQLEIRSDSPTGFTAKSLTPTVNATINVDRAVGGSGLNQTVNLGTFTQVNNRTLTIMGRNGYAVTIATTSTGNFPTQNSYTNNSSGTLTFTGNLWNNTQGGTTGSVLTLGGAGNINVLTNITTGSSSAPHLVIKSGAGTLTVFGAANHGGLTDIQNGTWVTRDFTGLGNGTNASAINLGSGANTGTLSFIGAAGTGVVGSSARPIVLNGTIGGGRINANQAGSAPTAAIFTGTISVPTTNTKVFTLGGPSTLDNEIGGSIPNNSIGGAVSVVKTDAGTWVLSGANTYSGGTTIANGTLKLKATAAASNVLWNIGTISFNADLTTQSAGGRLVFTGAGAPTTEFVDAINLVQGHGVVSVQNAGFATNLDTSLVAGSTNGASVNFQAGETDSITVSSPMGFLRASAYYNGANYAYVGQGGVLRTPIYTDGIGGAGGDPGFVTNAFALTSFLHNELKGNASVGATTINSLKITGPQTLTLTGDLTINTGSGTGGGILVAGGAATITGTGVTQGLGALPNGNALVIRVNGSGDSLLLDAPISSSTFGGVAKNGDGTLILSKMNNQAGGVNINEGTVRLTTGSRLGATGGALTLRQNAILDLNAVSTGTAIGSFNGAGIVTNNGSAAATLTVGNNGGPGTFSGLIQNGVSPIIVIKQSTGNVTWSGLNTYTGTTTINSVGLVSIPLLSNIGQASGIGTGDATSDATNAGSLIFGTAANANNGGGLSYTGTASVSVDRLFTLGSQVGTIATNGAQIAANGFNNATLILNKTNAITYAEGANSVAQTLTLGGASTGDNQINLRLTNPVGGPASAVLNVTKSGAGTWVLGNATNDYTGTTNISGGRLIAPAGALSATSPVSLTGSAILETTGSITRSVAPAAVTGASTLTWAGSGGFAAATGPLRVNLGGSRATLTWNSGGFLPNTGIGGTMSNVLVLNSISALDEVEFQNGINFDATTGPSATLARTIQVDDNSTTALDRATISGPISGTLGTQGFIKAGAGSLYLLGSNTYVGSTNLNSGTLGVTSIDNSLGNASNLLNFNALGGRLEYLGGAETSARTIIITNSGTIDASGSGPILLTNVIIGGAASKTITLQGLNTDANEIASALHNSGTSITTVNKTGGGTWVLSGINTYTGNTNAISGNLGFGSNLGAGAGTLNITNGNVFADGGDRVLANPVNLSSNATGGVIGVNSLTLSGPVSVAIGVGSAFNNFVAPGKRFEISGPVSYVDSGVLGRNLILAGTGKTVLSGVVQNGTAGAAFGLAVNSGTLVIGGASPNTFSGGITVNGGTLELAGSSGDAIPHGLSKGAVTFSNTTLPASFLLNGRSETINGLISNSTGAKVIDNNSASPATLTLGGGDGVVNFNGDITNSGGGPLSIVKTGTAAGVFSGNILSYSGSTKVEAGGSLSFPRATPAATSGIDVAGGASLSLVNGVGSPLTALSSLRLGIGGGTTVLSLEVGSSSDTLTTTGAAVTSGNINFALSAVAGFSPLGGTYDLLTSAAGGFNSATFGLATIPGGFQTSIDISNPNKVRLVATPAAAGAYFWSADVNRSWGGISGSNTNWFKGDFTDTGTTPGASDVVVFSSNNSPPSTTNGNIILVTLDGNQAADSLLFNGVPQIGSVTANVHIAQGVGAGVLRINPTNTFEGITIPDNGGTASIAAPVEIAADQTWDVGTATFAVPTPLLTVSGVMSGTGRLTKEGLGLLTLTGVNTRQSATTIQLGVLNINGEEALGANPASPGSSHLTIDGGTLRSIAALTIDDANRGLRLGNSGGTFDTTGGNITVSATNVISGPGALTKVGPNTLVLNAANTYTGSTTLSLGTIRLGSNKALSSSAVTMNGTGTALEFADGVTSTNAVTIADAGIDKTLRLLAGATSATHSGIITVAETTAGNFRAQASTGGTLNLNGAILQSGTSASGLRVNELAANTGVVVLSGANTYAGTTEIRGGTLRNGASEVIPGALTVNAVTAATPSATYDLDGKNEMISLLTYGAAASTAAAFMNLVTTGTGTLTLGGSVITLAGNTGAKAELRGKVVLDATRTFTVADATAQTTDLWVSADVSGNGGLTKIGAGTMEMSGTNTYSGTTMINAGTLLLSGSVTGMVRVAGGNLTGTGSVGVLLAASGTVAPGNVALPSTLGTLTAEAVTLAASSTFALEISTSALTNDQLISNQDLFLEINVSPKLTITVISPDVPVPLGTKFTFLTYAGSWNGGIFSIAGNPISDDIEYFQVGANVFALDYNDGGHSVSLVAVPEPVSASLTLGGFGLLAGLRRRRARSGDSR